MGNNASRTQKYYNDILEKRKAGTLTGEALDPYEVFGLRKDFTWEELRDAYRQRAKLVHPDKGGTELLFQGVTDCFRQLAQEYRARNADRPHYDLKQESMRFAESQEAGRKAAKAAQGPETRAHPTRIARKGEDFNKKFNDMFEKNRLEDDDDHGYADMMAPSSKVREDITVAQHLKPIKANDAKFRDRFNSAFEEATAPAGTAVTKYVEPEVLALSRQLAYTEIGGGRPGEYTVSTMDAKNKGITYTDYKSAYTNPRLVDPRAVEQRRAYRNVDEFINDRDARTETALTEEELLYQQEKARREEEREEARKRRVQTQDARYQEHYDRVSSLMLRR